MSKFHYEKLNIDRDITINFSNNQMKYMKFYRKNIFKRIKSKTSDKSE